MLRRVQTGKNGRIMYGAISEIVEDYAQSQSSYNSVLGNSSQQLRQQFLNPNIRAQFNPKTYWFATYMLRNAGRKTLKAVVFCCLLQEQ